MSAETDNLEAFTDRIGELISAYEEHNTTDTSDGHIFVVGVLEEALSDYRQALVEYRDSQRRVPRAQPEEPTGGRSTTAPTLDELRANYVDAQAVYYNSPASATAFISATAKLAEALRSLEAHNGQ